MKIKLTVLIVLFALQGVFAQNYQTVEDINTACATLGFSGNEDAEIAVDDILDKIGLSRNFILQECPEINNAIAKNIDDGSGHKERYILYDSNFFKQIEVKAGNDWAATSVLAHEIGHHLNGHALNNAGSNHVFELEADEFSGFILAKMGSSLEDAQSAIQTLRYEKATSTHPAKADRLLAIEKGWSRGAGHNKIIKKGENFIENATSAEDVVSNYILAIGGKNRIGDVKSTLQISTLNYEGMKMEMTIKFKYPNKNSILLNMSEINVAGAVFNGTTGYSIVNGQKINFTKNELEDAKKTASFFELDLARTGVFLGTDWVEGKEVYVVMKGKNKLFFDKESSLKIQEITTSIDAAGNETHSNMKFSDYKEVQGILFPHLMLMDMGGGMLLELRTTEIKIDEGVADEDFE